MSVRRRLLLAAAGWLAICAPGKGRAETFAIILAGADDAVPAAIFHCAASTLCEGRATLRFGETSIPLSFTMDVNLSGETRFTAIDGVTTGWRFTLIPDRSGGFALGRTPATLWLTSIGIAQQPVLRAPSGTMVGPVVVMVAREGDLPTAPTDGRGGR